MEASTPDLRLQLANVLSGTIDLNQFQTWIAQAEAEIELSGTEADVDLLDRVTNLLAEYTGNHITAAEVIDTLRAELPIENVAPAATSRRSA